MSDTAISIVIVITILLVVGGSIYYSVWELKVKEDFKFLTREQFKVKYPRMYKVLYRPRYTLLNTKTNTLHLVCPVCRKNPVAPDRDGTCVDCSH